MVVGRLIVCSLIKGLQLFRPHLTGLGFFLRAHSFTVTRLLSLPPSFHEAYHIVSRVWDSLFSLLLTLDVDFDVDVAIALVQEWIGIGIRAQIHPKTNKKKGTLECIFYSLLPFCLLFIVVLTFLAVCCISRFPLFFLLNKTYTCLDIHGPIATLFPILLATRLVLYPSPLQHFDTIT